MPLIHCKSLSLAFGDVALLDHVEFAIDRRERIALIGRNGAGKSSLIRILAGEIAPDDGEVVREKGVRFANVPQEPTFAEGITIEEAVTAGAINEHEGDEDWHVTVRVAEVLSRLGMDGSLLVSTLSGGMKKRVALARAIAGAPDLLFLDEPTNHLDFDGIAWLEDTLKAFSGAVLTISHDRRFLESFATRIVELDRGTLFSYPGSFVEYQRRKAEMLNSESLANARFDKLLKEEEVWIRKGVEARRTRNEGRVRRLEELRRVRAARRDVAGLVKLSLDAGERSGKIVAELVNVSKNFGDKVIIRDFSAILQRGDRIGLIGPNGAGKTTLIKLMLADLEADSGNVKRGTQLQVAYFDQFREALDDNATLSDVISPGSEFVEIGGARKHVISYLGDFLFPPQRARAKVKSLSGGERNRLLLARLFAKPANVLVLDEPTNDLDIETLELLESMLQEYAGTVILVSHDRAFLDNVVTQVFAFEGGGRIQEYVGGYAEWQSQAKTDTSWANAAKTPANAGVSFSGAASVPPAPATPVRKVKMSFNETRELEQLPGKIEALEKEQANLTEALADGSLFVKSPDTAADMSTRLEVVASEIEAAMNRWELLETKRTGLAG
ncbi:MAG: ATP-binding cassette domain-containing protein [Burkholderiales bacterium]|jgi:ATP-binding cassette subfamily F protein uup|nr:ATP-binding cassette domain-containing protein [Betaproteobacteria bacterium]